MRLHTLTLLLPVVSFAATPDQWVPARWQGGPLEIIRRESNKTLPSDPAVRETIRRWYDPSTLDLLKDTPINCLLVTWSAGADPAVEKEQQQLVTACARQARERRLAVLGLVHSPAGASTVPAVLDGLVLEGDYPAGDKAAVVFPLAPRERLLRDARWPILALSDSLWPRVKPITAGASAGPTGDPWLDSNPWRVRSLGPSRENRPVWLGHIPANPLPDDYPRAVADAAMVGARWIVALDDELRHRLVQKNPQAIAVWRRIAGYLKFYQDHRDWTRFSPRARLAAVQDRAAKNPFLSGEILNLFSRRQMPYHVLDRAQLSPAALSGFDAVTALDLDPPSETERRILSDFAAAGGLVVAPPSWNPKTAQPPKSYKVEPTGRGRIAVYAKPPSDPFAVSLDVLTLMGRNNLGVRLFNVSPILSSLTADPSGKQVLLQLVNYADSPVEDVTARLAGEFRTAHLYDPEAPPAALPLDPFAGTVEIRIPKVSISAAVLLE